MNISTKRTLAFILSFVIVCFLAWVGGVEFNERGINLAFTLWMALLLSGVAASYPFGK